MKYQIRSFMGRFAGRADDDVRGWKTCCRNHPDAFRADTRAEAEAAAAEFQAACAGMPAEVVEVES